MALRVMIPFLALVAVALCAVVHAAPADQEHPVLLSREVRAVKDQSILLGQLRPYDRLLASKNVYKSSTIFMKHEEKITFTLTSGIISHIKIDDMMKNGKNAEVKVKSGGVGQREVTLKFKSQRGENINYTVSIYGQ